MSESTNIIENDTIKKINDTNILLANIILLFHVIIILFVLIAPFSNIMGLLVLHFVFCFSLLVHWVCNNNICSLSYMEAKLRGLDYTESLTHKFIGPMYDISNTTWSTICYFLTIFLMTLSFYYIYRSNVLNLIYNDCIKISELTSENPDKYTLYDKFKLYCSSFQYLFVV